MLGHKDSGAPKTKTTGPVCYNERPVDKKAEIVSRRC